MKRTHRKPKKIVSEIKEYRINEAIMAQTLRLIDEEKGSSELISREKALELAVEMELDLVEVSPNMDPPVVKILDYGKIQYQREKMMRKQKAGQKKSETKGIRLSARISQHDLEVRINNADKFLERGDRVKIDLMLRGREHQHVDKAFEVVKAFISKLKEKRSLIIEQVPVKQGNTISALVAPGK